MIEALDAADIPWEVIVETDSDRTIEATVSADLAIHTMIEGTEPPHLERIDHNNVLPDLPMQQINLYGAATRSGVIQDSLADLLRRAFSGVEMHRLKAV